MNMKAIVGSKIGHLQYGLLEDAAQREKRLICKCSFLPRLVENFYYSPKQGEHIRFYRQPLDLSDNFPSPGGKTSARGKL
jgi:hypothetical protein